MFKMAASKDPKVIEIKSNKKPSPDIYTCEQFAEFVKRLIIDEYEGINYNNFEDYDYNHIYSIFSSRFSVNNCYNELKAKLTWSNLWGTGCKVFGTYVVTDLDNRNNKITTNGIFVAENRFNYYIPDVVARNRKFRLFGAKLKTRVPLDIRLEDGLAKL